MPVNSDRTSTSIADLTAEVSRLRIAVEEGAKLIANALQAQPAPSGDVTPGTFS